MVEDNRYKKHPFLVINPVYLQSMQGKRALFGAEWTAVVSRMDGYDALEEMDY